MAATGCVPALHGDREREIISSSTNMCLFPEEPAWHSLLHEERRCPGCQEMRTATPASRTEPPLERASPPAARPRPRVHLGMLLGVKPQPCPLFIRKVQRAATFPARNHARAMCWGRAAPGQPARGCQKNAKLEKAEPEDCEDCECPTNHAALPRSMTSSGERGCCTDVACT